jgi:hypothetical protein
VRAAQRVIDGLAGGLGLGDLFIELAELTPSQPLPVVGSDGAGGHECLLLSERKPDVAQQQDDSDEPDGRIRVATLPGNPGHRWQQANFLVVAQGRGGNPSATGQLTDAQQPIGHLDFKRT